MIENITSFFHIITATLFIISIRFLSSPETAVKGNFLGICGMIIAVMVTLLSPNITIYKWIITSLFFGGIIGILCAFKVQMTSLPQLIAAFNSLGGLSSVLIASGEIINTTQTPIETSLGLIIGGITFSGSLIAFAKLQKSILTNSIIFRGQQLLNLVLFIGIIVICTYFCITLNTNLFYIMTILTLILGVLLVLPIGGADMPIVISLLNAYSGWAAASIGFSLNNIILIIVGAIIGVSGTILSYIMVKAMNRSLISVILGGFGQQRYSSQQYILQNKIPQSGTPEDAAFIMKNAHKVIIVPGYGMAVARAQHILHEMAKELHEKYGVEVKYAIHPVAGRMPGHMNVLLAEANVSYEDVFELENINREFASTDVAYVIGANDITNPLAQTDASSPIYGMPILDVAKAKTIFFVKRSLASGYSGVENPLFYADNTIMLYGDAKKITEQIVAALEK